MIEEIENSCVLISFSIIELYRIRNRVIENQYSKTLFDIF